MSIMRLRKFMSKVHYFTCARAAQNLKSAARARLILQVVYGSLRKPARARRAHAVHLFPRKRENSNKFSSTEVLRTKMDFHA
jgi:hypothetical protein